MGQVQAPPAPSGPSPAYGFTTFRAAAWLHVIPSVPLALSGMAAWDLLVTAAQGEEGKAVFPAVLLLLGSIGFGLVRSLRIELDLTGRLRQRFAGRASEVDLSALIPTLAVVDPSSNPRAFDLRDIYGGHARIWVGLWRDGTTLSRRIRDALIVAGVTREAPPPAPPRELPKWDRRRRIASRVRPGLLVAFLMLASVAGRHLLFEALAPPDACDRAEAILEGYPEGPTQDWTGVPPRYHTADGIEAALLPRLLDDPGPGFVLIGDGVSNIPVAARNWANPDAFEVFSEHGLQGGAGRIWQTPDNLRLEHLVHEFPLDRDARSFQLTAARYGCRFADDVWATRVRHPTGETTPGLGLRFLYEGGGGTEQVSWVRGDRRHVLSLGLLRFDDRHSEIEALAQDAGLQDGGAPIWPIPEDQSITIPPPS